MKAKKLNQKIANIWADWNERKISGNEAIHKIGKLFPRVTLREWNRRMKVIEEKAAIKGN